MKTVLALFAAVTALAASVPAIAGETGPAGGGQPFNNQQPYQALTQTIQLQGIFPSRDVTQDQSTAAAYYIASMRSFAFGFAPHTYAQAQGQILSIQQNTALFSLLGTNYGGNGQTTFALPDLRGRTIIGTGQGNGLTNRVIGEQDGQNNVTLTVAQMPAHSHAIDVAPGQSGITGGSQPFDNMQPSLAMTYMIATGGIYQGGDPFIGQVNAFAGNFAPTGWLPADGRLVEIAKFDTLFNLIGTTYGGDGQTTFALPDLRGRAVVGAGGQYQVGDVFGSESTTITLSQLAAHDHDGGAIDVSPAGGGQPIDNRQPSLALNYYIALQGIFPSQDSGGPADNEPYLGEIVASAGTLTPNGYALAAGQLLSIAQNQALFALLGTTYGGDGRVTFALPDLRGRIVEGWGGSVLFGERGGSNTITLTEANLPIHTHSLPDVAPGVPEPATWAMMIAGFAMAGGAVRRRRVVIA
ncbi:tail fiber protein [Sphingomonas tabacisoli]|uniref:Tail fiber protein n=1 Tax=Sphingomonas tabacisoli TaxID=2249466 RepID=A0ABW4I783_9SPHN